MTFLSKILKPHFTSSRGLQGIQGIQGTQGIQGVQGTQGVDGLSNGTLITNTQPSSYTLQSSDVGKVVSGVSTVGIPSDVFNPGENIVILNNDLDKTILDIEGKSPAVSIYEAGVGVALTENKRIKNKSFISLFCTRLNVFIVGGNLFNLPIEATGGTATIDSDGYRIHVFTGTGPFNVSKISSDYNTVEYVVVAGGGGGGTSTFPLSFQGGGGGAGGFRTGTNFPITVQDYTITVGGGGNGGTPETRIGSNGSDSIFSTITSTRGGYGAGVAPSATAVPGGLGGSGGGARARGNPSHGGSGNTPPTSPPQGNNGGDSIHPMAGGGGGGASVQGSPTPEPGSGGAGGNGSQVTWVPDSYGTIGPSSGRWFAGGGGGGGETTSGSGGAGGGATATPTANPAESGTTNTGGGGAGVGGNTPGRTGGNGGSGIVIIRYPIT